MLLKPYGSGRILSSMAWVVEFFDEFELEFDMLPA
jgi:hypothetical protein